MSGGKFLIVTLLGLHCATGNAQDATVEMDILNVQAGLLAFFVSYETKLGKETSLRLETGLDNAWSGGFSGEEITVISPLLNIAPMWYYNLPKRASQGKSVAGNSGDFLALRSVYYPSWFTGIRPQLTILPTWGMRRRFWDNFHYELGFAAGYRHRFYGDDSLTTRPGKAVWQLHLRLGYGF